MICLAINSISIYRITTVSSGKSNKRELMAEPEPPNQATDQPRIAVENLSREVRL